jgi:Tol biopolymer transport system component
LRISPDGKRVALTRNWDVWQMEFARGIPTRVTFDGGVGVGSPLWSPGSQRIAYSKGAPPNLFSRNTNGTGSEERLIESHDTLIAHDWSPDGRFLLYSLISNDLSLRTRPNLWLLPMAGDRKPVPFLTTPFREGPSQFSLDGKWIAYSSDESGRNEVYVQSFPPTGIKWQVSSTGGDWVRWRSGANELFYISPNRAVMSVAARTVSGSLEFGTPSALFAIPVTPDDPGAVPYSYDVMPDGQRFLTLAPVADIEDPPMTVILNWQAELSAAKN